MKVNFGCGSIQPNDWVNVDRQDFGQEHIGSTVLFDADSVDLLVAHCSLQINEHDYIPSVLADIYRVMKPGGVARFSLPDIHAGFDAWRRRDISWFPNSEDDIDDRFSNWLTWYSTTRVLLTPAALANRLHNSGFSRIDLADYRMTEHDPALVELDTREGECFFMDAVK